MAELETPGPVNDPIASLHRMSTTAGVGSAEYVAINNLAIVCAVLGLITGLAFFGAPFMLIGVAALGCGAIALWQIGHSNGTQGGRGVAWVGILLALMMCGGAIALESLQASAQRKHEALINLRIGELGQLVSRGEYAKAYDMFDDAFKGQFPLAAFESRWKALQDNLGPLKQMESNGIYQFTPMEGGEGASTKAKVRFERSASEGRWTMTFIQRPNAGWKIFSMPEFLEPGRPRGGR